MKSWGKQVFLNPPSSPDSGWAKFSVSRKGKSRDKSTTLGRINATFAIADCTNRIDLEFDVWGDSIDRSTIKTSRLKLQEIKERRKKVALLQRATEDFFVHYEIALDEAEAELLEWIEQQESRIKDA